jgi:hypothetical protein
MWRASWVEGGFVGGKSELGREKEMNLMTELDGGDELDAYEELGGRLEVL